MNVEQQGYDVTDGSKTKKINTPVLKGSEKLHLNQSKFIIWWNVFSEGIE